MNIHRNYQRNFTIVVSRFVQKCQAILNKGFVLLWTNSPSLHYLSILFRILTHEYSFQNTTILVTNRWNRSHFSWIFFKFLTFTVHTFVLNQMCPSPSQCWAMCILEHWDDCNTQVNIGEEENEPSVSRFVTSIVDPRHTGSRVRISDCWASSILKTVPVSQDSMLNASLENLSTTILHRDRALCVTGYHADTKRLC